MVSAEYLQTGSAQNNLSQVVASILRVDRRKVLKSLLRVELLLQTEEPQGVSVPVLPNPVLCKVRLRCLCCLESVGARDVHCHFDSGLVLGSFPLPLATGLKSAHTAFAKMRDQDSTDLRAETRLHFFVIFPLAKSRVLHRLAIFATKIRQEFGDKKEKSTGCNWRGIHAYAVVLAH